MYGTNLGNEPGLANVTVDGYAARVAVSSPHTAFTVTSPPGVGASSVIRIAVGGQEAPLQVMLGTFAYTPPEVRRGRLTSG